DTGGYAAGHPATGEFTQCADRGVGLSASRSEGSIDGRGMGHVARPGLGSGRRCAATAPVDWHDSAGRSAALLPIMGNCLVVRHCGWHRWPVGTDSATRLSGVDAATAGADDGPARVRGTGRAAAARTVAADAGDVFRSAGHESVTGLPDAGPQLAGPAL